MVTGIGHKIKTDEPQLVINTILQCVQTVRSEGRP